MPICSDCGHTNRPQDHFCSQCRRPLETAAAPEPAWARRRFRFSPRRLSLRSGRRRLWPYVVAGALVAAPVIYGAGYLSSFHQAAMMRQELAPLANAAGVSPVPSRARAVRQPATPTANPRPHQTSVTARHTHPVTAVTAAEPLAPVRTSIAGTIVNGHLEGTVYLTGPAILSRVRAIVWIDTGAQISLVSGAFMRELGIGTSGRATGNIGYGGLNTQDYWYRGLSAYTAAQGNAAVFAGATLQSGGLSHLGVYPDILLGENFLKQGVLVQDHATWRFTFRGPMKPNGPALTRGDLGVIIPVAPAGAVPLSGTVADNTLVGGSDIGTTSRVLLPGRLMVDTGAFTTTVNGPLLESQFHAQPGAPFTIYGTGGAQQGNLFHDVYLYTYESSQPLLLNATIADGLTGSINGQPLEISIGENSLGYGLFYQVGLRWWAALESLEGPANLPGNKVPWWYPKYVRPNPGP